jgi:hypothetical protein
MTELFQRKTRHGFIRFFLLLALLLSATFSDAQPITKPDHGVAVTLDVLVVSDQTACVFVSLASAEPIEPISMDWLQGNWIEDSRVDCQQWHQNATFSAQIPAMKTKAPVVVKVRWQLGNEVFSAMRQWSGDLQNRTFEAQTASPQMIDSDQPFIIRIGE